MKPAETTGEQHANGGRASAKLVSEIYLTRLLSAKVRKDCLGVLRDGQDIECPMTHTRVHTCCTSYVSGAIFEIGGLLC